MKTRIVVFHSGYGCDTGCCGHRVERFDVETLAKPDFDPTLDDNVDGRSDFTFSHPYGNDHIEFAKRTVREEFGAEHVADLDWGHCIVTDNCQ